MTWILVAAAAALVGGGAEAVTANQNRQKQKGVIGKAYDTASSQLALGQKNTREDTAEETVQRGLAGGGDVTAGAPASSTTPSAGGARTLGGQVGKDLGVQQSLEKQNLSNMNEAQLAEVNAQGNAGEVAGAANGISGALGALSTPRIPAGTTTPPPATSPIAAAYGVPTGAPGPTSSPYSNTYNGIDPVNPLGRGSWAKGGSTSDFNVFASPADRNQ